uniref:Uncharacterized protein n=1 Tax=Panagrellus redivivus TaxID=6233 RepID=A0A7E4VKT2_PANRE
MQLPHVILKCCDRADCLNFGSQSSSTNVVSMCHDFDTNAGPQAVSMTVEYGNVNPKRTPLIGASSTPTFCPTLISTRPTMAPNS